jgi:hypothetical protein
LKIFCIGLNKTGTISLHRALELLGFNSLHWGGPNTRRQIEQAIAEGRPLVEDFAHYDAFSDIWVLSENFDLIDRQYPGSKFILTTRDLGSWLESRRRHVETNILNKVQGQYDGNFLTIDEDAWSLQHREHHSRVRAYFADRPNDLLVMNIVAGDGYDVLCPFLGLPVPDDPFPWSHRGAIRPAATEAKAPGEPDMSSAVLPDPRPPVSRPRRRRVARAFKLIEGVVRRPSAGPR